MSMKKLTELIDMSCWTGHWPFIHLRYGNLAVLEAKLRSLCVTKAFISPTEAILEQDPIRANLALLDMVNNDIFSPVPVIDLSYRNWEENLTLVIHDSRVKMIKIIPNYHMYKMYDEDMGSLVEYTRHKNLKISIQLNIEDPRAQYPLLKVERVHHLDVIKTLSRFPDQIFLLNGVRMDDLPYYMESLTNVYIDIAWLERQDILAYLHENYTLDKFLFASHCPFFFPEGNINKIKYANLRDGEIDKLAFKTARDVFLS
jgi:hypothetical protein